MGQHWTWRSGPVEPGPTVVVDIDGVLSDAARRQHYLEEPFPDWRGFFDACGEDHVIEEVKALLDLLDPNLRIVLLTGRPLPITVRMMPVLISTRRMRLSEESAIKRPPVPSNVARSVRACPTSQPVTPCTTLSGSPPARVASTAFSRAIASSVTSELPS